MYTIVLICLFVSSGAARSVDFSQIGITAGAVDTSTQITPSSATMNNQTTDEVKTEETGDTVPSALEDAIQDATADDNQLDAQELAVVAEVLQDSIDQIVDANDDIESSGEVEEGSGPSLLELEQNVENNQEQSVLISEASGVPPTTTEVTYPAGPATVRDDNKTETLRDVTVESPSMDITNVGAEEHFINVEDPSSEFLLVNISVPTSTEDLMKRLNYTAFRMPFDQKLDLALQLTSLSHQLMTSLDDTLETYKTTQ